MDRSKRKRVGVNIRKFCRKPEGVPGTIEDILNVVEKLLSYTTVEWYVSDILVMVPTNKKYKDSDCGQLVPALRVAWQSLVTKLDEIGLRVNVEFIEDNEGDLFVGVQNLAAAMLIERGDDVMVTLAPSAFKAGYFDLNTAKAMMEAHANGAKVMAVAVPEDGIDEFVAHGTAGGPIIGWDLQALASVNGFNETAAQAPIGSENPNAGCEEIHPIVGMIKKYGPCYAPIAPRNVNVTKRTLEGEELERHRRQIETKTTRQETHARAAGAVAGPDLDGDWFYGFFASGVMPRYRLQPEFWASEWDKD